MANNVTLKLTNYGLNNVISKGAEKTFKYFSFSDMNEIYHVTTKPNLEDIMNITGSKTLFTARKSCNDSVPTAAQVIPPSESTLTKTEQRWVVNYYKENCGAQDYLKTNLDVTVNLHEYFYWLEGVAQNTAYTESLETSLRLIQGTYLNKQEQNFVDKSWKNIESTNNFSASYEFVTEQDKKNYAAFNSKWVTFEGTNRRQIDKSFDRFYTSLLFGFGVNAQSGLYLEGHNSFLTFQPPQFGYVVNGTTNFLPLNKLVSPDNYDEIRPATIIGSDNKRDLYYLNEPKKYLTNDLNGFMGQAIWGFKNVNGKSLVEGMIDKAKNHIEFYFEETSFDKWELPISLRLKLSNTGGLKLVGGNVKFNFVYEPNATILGYNNILIVK
jgi:hypothetical protein